MVDTVASVALAAGGVYFGWQGLAFASRRLLWRVRRKLIISYIFIGFIPSMLIVAFFVLGGFFLFSNFSSYPGAERVPGARSTARCQLRSALALDIERSGRGDVRTILLRRQAIVAMEFPGVSMAVVPINRPCVDSSSALIVIQPPAASEPRAVTAGPWAHVAPPVALPDWLGDCSGFSGLLLYRAAAGVFATNAAPIALGSSSNDVGLIARAVSFTNGANPGYGVIVDIVIDDRFRQELRSGTGVHLTTVQPRPGDVQPLAARSPPAIGSGGDTASTLPLMSVAFLKDRDWTTGAHGAVLASGQLSIPDIYRRISTPASGGESFSQGLLVVLVVIGILFLIIQAMALVTGLALARSITGSVHDCLPVPNASGRATSLPPKIKPARHAATIARMMKTSFKASPAEQARRSHREEGRSVQTKSVPHTGSEPKRREAFDQAKCGAAHDGAAYAA